jgi:hypothetical protein
VWGGKTPTGRLTILKSYGGHSEGETPGPIPNPEAKPLCADGTARETVWESRTPPDNHYNESPPHHGVGFRHPHTTNGQHARQRGGPSPYPQRTPQHPTQHHPTLEPLQTTPNHPRSQRQEQPTPNQPEHTVECPASRVCILPQLPVPRPAFKFR